MNQIHTFTATQRPQVAQVLPPDVRNRLVEAAKVADSGSDARNKAIDAATEYARVRFPSHFRSN